MEMKMGKMLVAIFLVCIVASFVCAESNSQDCYDCIRSVDGLLKCDIRFWHGEYVEIGGMITSSPVSGYKNNAARMDRDYVMIFQVVGDGDGLVRNMHEWLKFPRWSMVQPRMMKIKGNDVCVFSRKGFNDQSSDQVYAIKVSGDKWIFLRLYVYAKSTQEFRCTLVTELMDVFEKNSMKCESARKENLKDMAPFLKDAREVPDTLQEAGARFVKESTPGEIHYLMDNIDNPGMLIEEWPENGGNINRIDWIMYRWGLNDPTSPLRKSIGLPDGKENDAYIYEVLKSAWTLITGKHTKTKW